MPALSFAPALSLLALFGRTPTRPLRTFIRATSNRLRPPAPQPYRPIVDHRQTRILREGLARDDQRAHITWEPRRGDSPTIILGGFVPDPVEQVFLLRGFLLRQGSVYYVHYPSSAFSADLLFAQLDDLVEELATVHGRSPVVFGVSFGAGLAFEWLRQARRSGRTVPVRGNLLISPVACVEDLLVPGEAKPSTLLGRAIKPYLDAVPPIDSVLLERSRAVFTRMFESGAQNKEALSGLLTRGELAYLREAVLGTVRRITGQGAWERVNSLRRLEPPQAYFGRSFLPLSDAPTLILYAEKEGSVLAESSPTRMALASSPEAYFPRGACRVVTNRRGSPVQHASLIFHCFNFLPPISAFYRGLKKRNALKAA
jgi:pimeloyl-ACP methyl ester carboxylesterase